MKNSNVGITMFKETFEYLINGDLTKDQFGELAILIYNTKWGDGTYEENITDRDVRLIWKTLRHSVKKSASNSKNYEERKNKTDIPSNTDFDSEISGNKDLNISNDTNPQPTQESVSNQKGINENEGIVIDSWEAYRNAIANKVQAS